MCLHSFLSLACDLMNSFQWLCKVHLISPGRSHLLCQLCTSCRTFLRGPWKIPLKCIWSMYLLLGPQKGRSGPDGGWTKNSPCSSTPGRSMQKARDAFCFQYTECTGNLLKFYMKTGRVSFLEIRNPNDCACYIHSQVSNFNPFTVEGFF